MKVAIHRSPKQIQGIPWVACEPFVDNSRGSLIHRVRYVSTHQVSEKYKPHLAVSAWCGMTATGTKNFTFLAVPPDGRMVCARCEDKYRIAIAAALEASK